MSQTLSVSEANMDNYTLSVTTRENGDDPKHLEELTYRTIKIWLWIASHLEQGVYKLPDNPGSVESRYAAELTPSPDPDDPAPETFTFEPVWGNGDARVTVWDTYRGNKRINFHLNSDDDLQVAVDTWLAQRRALERAVTDFATPQQKVAASASNIIQDAQKNGAAPDAGMDKPATPKHTPQTPKSGLNAQNGYSPEDASAEVAAQGKYFTKKEAIAKLQSGDKFRMKVVQIKKRSTDGKDFYEFYEAYGGKPGDFSAVSIFTDNEIAINNGLIAYLDSFGIKVGQALTGDWIVNCAVGKPKTKTVKGEEKTFTNIYVNSFEGQELGDLA